MIFSVSSVKMLRKSNDYAISMVKSISENRLSAQCRQSVINELNLKVVGGVIILDRDFCDVALAHPEILKDCDVDPMLFGACCSQPSNSCDGCRSMPSQPCRYQTWTEYFQSFIL